MQKLRRVDKKRFKELTYPHLQFLYNVALKYSGKPYDAEDLVQETMYTAYRKFFQLREEEKCRSWLFMILRSHFLKERRLAVRRPFLDDGDGYLKNIAADTSSELPGIYEKKIDREEVQRVLLLLPEKFKSPLILYYMEEFTYQEISEYLDIPIGTVMSRLSRGKKYMKNELLHRTRKTSILQKIVPIAGFFAWGGW
ncbi:MAG: RNA polymerase sigma factor [Desulfopila sp.]|jgi:RNA polymerase sigma-70 factor (ECF subfamily)|nr:RNA polymerase sigma factor [Desulfopila sp.]